MLQCGALGQFAAHACGPVGPRDHLGAGQCEHELVFRKGGTTASVRVEGRLRIAGNEGAIAAAVRRNGHRDDIERIVPSRNGQWQSRPRAGGLGFRFDAAERCIRGRPDH